MRRALATLALTAALAGCGSEPLTPYDLSAASEVHAKHVFPIAVEAVASGEHLDSSRILVLDSGDPLVLADARWSEALPALVASRVTQSLNAPSGPPQAQLDVAIRHFELHAQRRVVSIDLYVTALDPASGATLRQRDFSASAGVPTTRPADVAAGFDRAFLTLLPRIVRFAYDP